MRSASVVLKKICNSNARTQIAEMSLRERRQLGFVTLDGSLAFSEWVGLAYDR